MSNTSNTTNGPSNSNNSIEIDRTGPVILAANNAVSNILNNDSEFEKIIDFHFTRQDYHKTVVTFRPKYLDGSLYSHGSISDLAFLISDFEHEMGATIIQVEMDYYERCIDVTIRWKFKKPQEE